MAENSRNTNPHAENEEEEKLFAEKLEEFVDALECLYLYDNISGRHRFRKDWPAAAAHIYPADLMHVDDVGTKDKEFRTRLEGEADSKRLELLQQIEELRETYEQERALDAQQTREFINTLGRPLAALVLHENIIEKLVPSQPDPAHKPQSTETQTSQNAEQKPATQASPNLALKRKLFEAEPASAKVLTYKKLLKKVMRNPDKHRLRNTFNQAIKTA